MWEYLRDGWGGVGESNYKALVFTGKCRRPWRQHTWHHCDASLWGKKWTCVTLNKSLIFTPLNFISHYIRNLIMWWYITTWCPRVLKVRAMERPGELTHLCYRWMIHWTPAFRPCCPASLRRKPRPPFINASSWATAMSCQAALGVNALHWAHMQVLWVATQANITSLNSHRSEQIHLKNRPPSSLSQPEGVKSERPFNPDMNHGSAFQPRAWLLSPCH